MSQVELGMRVLDSAGEEIGKVDDLKFGDEEAVSTQGQQVSAGGGLVANLARAVVGGPNLHPQAVDRLLRVGYIRIDCQGVLAGHAFASADQVQVVAGGTVRLAVAANQLHSD